MSPSTLKPAATRFPADGRHARGLLTRLESAARRVVRRRRGAVVGWVLAAVIGLLSVAACADYFLELSTSVRAIWLALILIAAGTALTLGFRRWANRFGPAAAAAAIEARWPGYGQRLRTALDYENPEADVAPASPDLIAALQQEMQQGVREEHLAAPAAQQPVAWPWAAGLGWMFVCLMLISFSREWRIAAGRTLLLPGQYTTVTFDPRQLVLREGDSATINVQIAGRPVAEAWLRFRPAAGGEWQRLPLSAGKQADSKQTASKQTASKQTASKQTASKQIESVLHGDLKATIADCRSDVEFQIVAGPRELPLGSIRVLKPLLLESFTADITPPAYTRREPEQTVDQREMRVLEGSSVALRLQFSRPAEQVQLVSLDQPSASDGSPSSTVQPVDCQLEDRSALTQLDDLRKDRTFEIRARTADGVDADPLRLVIHVQLDHKPRIRIVKPSEQIEVTPTTEIPVAIEALDDLGLVQLGVLYQVGDGPMQTLWQQDFETASLDPARHAPQLLLEEHRLTFQDSVTYYAFADDRYFDETRRSVTPLQFIDIRPYKRSYQMLDNGGT
jgi:hypothetical protein